MKWTKARSNRAVQLVALLATLADGATSADRGYEVSISNVTKGESFRPTRVATHVRRVSLFEPGVWVGRIGLPRVQGEGEAQLLA